MLGLALQITGYLKIAGRERKFPPATIHFDKLSSLLQLVQLFFSNCPFVSILRMGSLKRKNPKWYIQKEVNRASSAHKRRSDLANSRARLLYSSVLLLSRPGTSSEYRQAKRDLCGCTYTPVYRDYFVDNEEPELVDLIKT